MFRRKPRKNSSVLLLKTMQGISQGIILRPLLFIVRAALIIRAPQY